MDKRFWLICITIPRNSYAEEIIPKYQLYRVSTDNPDSVTVPLNTLAFGFYESNDSKEEILKSLVVLKIKNDYTVTGCEKTYVPGKVVNDDKGRKLIYNKELDCSITITDDRIIPYD